MKITEIDIHIVLAPNMDPTLTSSAQDSLVVLIHTDEGVTGIGESDVKISVHRGLKLLAARVKDSLL